jgi:hypothetical protein
MHQEMQIMWSKVAQNSTKLIKHESVTQNQQNSFFSRRPLSSSVGASSYVENSIPMTTTLVNRMNRRSPTSPFVNRTYAMEHQRRSDPESTQKRKVGKIIVMTITIKELQAMNKYTC